MSSSICFSDIKIDQPVEIYMDADPRKSRIMINGQNLPVHEIRFFIKDGAQMIDLTVYGFRAQPFHVEARVTAIGLDHNTEFVTDFPENQEKDEEFA